MFVCFFLNSSFVKQYRMTQRIAFELIDEIRPFADPLGTIPIEIQVLSVLNFFASGSYQLYAFHNSVVTFLAIIFSKLQSDWRRCFQ